VSKILSQSIISLGGFKLTKIINVYELLFPSYTLGIVVTQKSVNYIVSGRLFGYWF
jgi:hypothetical protein